MNKVPPDIDFARSRRGFLKNGLGLGLGGLVSGCSSSVISFSRAGSNTLINPTLPTGPNQYVDTQPPMSGTPVNARVINTELGFVGTDFVGFSFEKSEFTTRIFVAGNTNVVNLFKALGPCVSRASGQLARMEDSYIVGISAGAPIVKVPPLTAVLVKAS